MPNGTGFLLRFSRVVFPLVLVFVAAYPSTPVASPSLGGGVALSPEASPVASGSATASSGLPCIAERGQWSLAGYMAWPRTFHTATLLQDGRVLVAGGLSGSTPLSSAEIYDPAGGGWHETGAMAGARHNHAAALLPDGRVLVTGGAGEDCATLPTAEVFDPATETWQVVPPMGVPRTRHTASSLPDGDVLVAGGVTDECWYPSPSIQVAERFDPGSGGWTYAAPLHFYRHHHTATRLLDGRILVAGGRSLVGFYFDGEVYDPAADAWTQTGFMSEGFSLHQAALLQDGRVLVAGGEFRNRANLFDPASLTWRDLEPMAVGRLWATATTLPTGRVLVAGGLPLDGTDGTRTAEVFDEAAGTWAPTGAMTFPRLGHTATALEDGRVLVVGGYTTSAEMYTPDFPCILGCVAAVPQEGEEGVATNFRGAVHPSACTGPQSTSWDFGDGETSDEMSPSHTYPRRGEYAWRFQASGDGQTCSKEGWIVVRGCTVDSRPEMELVSGPMPAVFSFRAWPQLSPQCHSAPSFLWDFGDGTTSTQQETSHAYTAFGEYSWSLTVTSGEESCLKQGVLAIRRPPGPEVYQAFKGTNPFRVILVGFNFQQGVKVKIDGVDWPQVKWKSNERIVIKGDRALKKKFPKCTWTLFTLTNPDCGESSWALYYCNKEGSVARGYDLAPCAVAPSLAAPGGESGR